MKPTLVVLRNSGTAPTALTSHKSLTDGARGLSHSHAPAISFHNALEALGGAGLVGGGGGVRLV